MIILPGGIDGGYLMHALNVYEFQDTLLVIG